MKRLTLFVGSMMVALCILAPIAGHAADVQALAQQAQQAASAGKTQLALGIYELALRESAGQPESVTGPLQGGYWQLIAKSGDFPRAMDFYSAMAAQEKSPGATLLANKASAIGSYIGWLYQNQLAESVPGTTLQRMDATARGDYDRALAIDPDNFAALYGYAIYESYSPSLNAKAHMKELLAKLNSLRAAHPHYPWALVEYLEQNGHPEI